MASTGDQQGNKSETLLEALRHHQIELPEDQVAGIDRYCTLLWTHNQRLNLTRHTDYATFVGRDVIDSLQQLC